MRRGLTPFRRDSAAQQPHAMKTSKFAWMIAAVALLAGCATAVNRRISEHQQTWQGLSERDQDRLRQGRVYRGDTEDMVTIALGRPDRVLPIAGQAGQEQSAWIYEVPVMTGGFDPNAQVPADASREKRVVFRDGVVVRVEGILTVGAAVYRTAPYAESQADRTAEMMMVRLDRLVGLTPEQQVKARDIFAKAHEELLAFSLEERPMKGMPIRVKMRADIRAILTAGQQATYDATPQYLGGGSMRGPRVQADSGAPQN